MIPKSSQFKMAKVSDEILRRKFRGCLLGGLIGDCLGSPYEGQSITPGDKIILNRYFDKLEDPKYEGPFRRYTDDTAMTKSVAKCLIDKPEVDYKFLARLFVKSFFQEPNRGYGENVVSVFHKLRSSKFEDVNKPALEQFDGTGSYGNGGAMRISPVALYFHDNYHLMLEVAAKTTKLTHTNVLGVHGALLQCMAIQQALTCDCEKELDTVLFVKELQDKMREVEHAEEDLDIEDTPYTDKLHFIQNLLLRKYDEPDEIDDEVIENLGNNVSALESVPTAIYCFLKAYSEAADTQTLFRRTVQYAISLGGDTDTIASMAGSVAGAYIGEENIPSRLIRHCEYNKEIVEMADHLLEARGAEILGRS